MFYFVIALHKWSDKTIGDVVEVRAGRQHFRKADALARLQLTPRAVIIRYPSGRPLQIPNSTVDATRFQLFVRGWKHYVRYRLTDSDIASEIECDEDRLILLGGVLKAFRMGLCHPRDASDAVFVCQLGGLIVADLQLRDDLRDRPSLAGTVAELNHRREESKDSSRARRVPARRPRRGLIATHDTDESTSGVRTST